MNITKILSSTSYFITNMDLVSKIGIKAATLVGYLAYKSNTEKLGSRELFVPVSVIEEDLGLSRSTQNRVLNELKEYGILDYDTTYRGRRIFLYGDGLTNLMSGEVEPNVKLPKEYKHSDFLRVITQILQKSENKELLNMVNQHELKMKPSHGLKFRGTLTSQIDNIEIQNETYSDFYTLCSIINSSNNSPLNTMSATFSSLLKVEFLNLYAMENKTNVSETDFVLFCDALELLTLLKKHVYDNEKLFPAKAGNKFTEVKARSWFDKFVHFLKHTLGGNYDFAEIRKVLNFAYADSFWCIVIDTPDKAIKHYEKIRHKAKTTGWSVSTNTMPKGQKTALLDKLHHQYKEEQKHFRS